MRSQSSTSVKSNSIGFDARRAISMMPRPAPLLPSSGRGSQLLLMQGPKLLLVHVPDLDQAPAQPLHVLVRHEIARMDDVFVAFLTDGDDRRTGFPATGCSAADDWAASSAE